MFHLLCFSQSDVNYRVSIYGGGVWNSKINTAPLYVGTSYWWKLNNSLSVSTGLTCWWNYGENSTWQTNNIVHEWDNKDALMLTITPSIKYNQPIFRFKHNNIGLFLEPGVIFNPLPWSTLNVDEYKYGVTSPSITTYTKTKFDFCYLFWQAHAGLFYKMSNNSSKSSLCFELSYMLSNLDLYKLYRNVNIEEENLNEYLPKRELISGFRIGLYAEF